jgi:DNA-binding GntR family transcriptional regulator
VQAIINRDAELAQSLVRSHVERTAQATLAAFNERRAAAAPDTGP